MSIMEREAERRKKRWRQEVGKEAGRSDSNTNPGRFGLGDHSEHFVEHNEERS